MLNTAGDIQDFGRMVEGYTRENRRREVEQAFNAIPAMCRSGEINRENVSTRTLFEELVPDGRERLRDMAPGQQRSGVFTEAGGATSTAHFSNVLGQIAYSDVLDEFDSEDLFGSELHTTRGAQTQQREMIPGVAMLGAQGAPVGENEEYPVVGFGEHYITQPKKIKDGFVVEVTDELIWEDNIGAILQRTTQGTEALTENHNDRLMNNALGITTSYSRNGGAEQATYAASHTQGDFDNLVTSNALVDYTSIETALLKFDAMLDLETSRPIRMDNAIDVIVPTALVLTAGRTFGAEKIEQGAIDASTPRVISSNPLSFGGRTFNVRSSNLVKFLSGSASTWWMGDFKNAFDWREVFPLQMFIEDRNSGAGWGRDVHTRLKVRIKGSAGVRSPQRVLKCTA